MHRVLVTVGLAAMLLLAPGCTSTDPDPEKSSPTAGETASSASARTVTVQFPEGEVTVTVHPVEVVDGRAVAAVDLALEDSGKSFIVGNALSIGGMDGVGGVRLVDLAGDRVWTPAVTSDGAFAATSAKEVLRPGESVRTVTIFAAPDVSSVAVMVPRAGLVDVPVVDGGSSTASMASLGLGGELILPEPVSIDAYYETYDSGVSSKSSGDEQSVVLSADVLFGSDEDTLDTAAVATVSGVAESIKAVAGSGEVLVVGHTDDVDTEEYNLSLSQRRAAAVAEALETALGDEFSTRTEGKGKSQPAVVGTSAEARAANRRVEISFTATSPPPIEGGAISEATVPVAAGHEQVEFEVKPNDDGSFKASVSKVVRRDGYLVGTVEISRSTGNGGAAFPTTLLGTGIVRQTYEVPDVYQSAWTLYILGSSSKVFPAQHLASEGVSTTNGAVAEGQVHAVAVLGDRVSSTASPVGVEAPWTVVWPDPGTDTISVEAPGRFRIVDIPVADE